MLLLLISIIAGILTVLAPCVLPLLPVIVGGSVSGGRGQRLRPYIIAASLAGSIIIFTLILKVSASLANVSVTILDYLSGGLLVALGLVGVFPEAWEGLVARLNWQSATQRLLGEGEQRRGALGPILIGLALGPVFSSCSPTYAFILASVLPRDFTGGLVYLIAYSLALVVTLLAIALASKRFLSRLNWVVDTHGWFRRVLGLVFIAIGIVIMLGQEVRLETWLAGYLPFDETKIEQILLTQQHQSIATPASGNGVLNVQPTPAPELIGLTNWINSTPLQLSQLRGKVVLVDFWTYSCVNCNRALPYVEKWYKAYQKDGLVVIGVHTPEFAFEHIASNVQQFVAANHITYPVALDNDYATWNAFQNDSWPADFLIDKQGNIRYVALGEGDYDVTEKAIQQLLGVKQPLQTPTSVVPISST
ncbi:MAG TPA: cytochrome c biogenesis protein/redoxin, partial [Candidatus Acidoferrum sp.]|nr:cytochrome c biogenesis protein/redoxin [Candidatus Acidoferrum sp.]